MIGYACELPYVVAKPPIPGHVDHTPPWTGKGSPNGRRKAEAEIRGYQFPYLYDDTQEVAKAYHAACTPDFFLFDNKRELVYRGQFDDSRPDSGIPVTGSDLRAAINAVLAGGQPNPNQRPSIGCNIKWKRGNEPDYFGT